MDQIEVDEVLKGRYTRFVILTALRILDTS